MCRNAACSHMSKINAVLWRKIVLKYDHVHCRPVSGALLIVHIPELLLLIYDTCCTRNDGVPPWTYSQSGTSVLFCYRMGRITVFMVRQPAHLGRSSWFRFLMTALPFNSSSLICGLEEEPEAVFATCCISLLLCCIAR